MLVYTSEVVLTSAIIDTINSNSSLLLCNIGRLSLRLILVSVARKIESCKKHRFESDITGENSKF